VRHFGVGVRWGFTVPYF